MGQPKNREEVANLLALLSLEGDLGSREAGGACFDVDGVLANAIPTIGRELQKRLGNTKGLSVEAILERYHLTYHFDDWKDGHSQEWFKDLQRSGIHEQFDMIPGAVEGVREINQFFGTSCYATTRLGSSAARSATERWLRALDFPEAHIFMQIDGHRSTIGGLADREKAQLISSSFDVPLPVPEGKRIVLMVDDSREVICNLEPSYGGVVIWFGHKDSEIKQLGREDLNIVGCPDWRGITRFFERVADRRIEHLHNQEVAREHIFELQAENCYEFEVSSTRSIGMRA